MAIGGLHWHHQITFKRARLTRKVNLIDQGRVYINKARGGRGRERVMTLVPNPPPCAENPCGHPQANRKKNPYRNKGLADSDICHTEE